LALGGVHDTALAQYIMENPHVKNIITALNNDRAEKVDEIKGHEASEIIRERFESKGLFVKKVFPKGNDWNDDLRAIRAEELEKKPVIEKGVEDQIKEYTKMKTKLKKQERGPTLTRSRSR
jgi:sialic acid synthase SpsE